MKKNTSLTNKEIRKDYKDFLVEKGISPEMEEQIQNSKEMLAVVGKILGAKKNGDKWKIKKSKIHGQGVFAKVKICKGELIDIGAEAGLVKQNWLSAKMNHHPDPNAQWHMSTDLSVKCYALRDIEKGEEIVNNYREIVKPDEREYTDRNEEQDCGCDESDAANDQ